MLKLNVLNVKRFWDTVNGCKDTIRLICEDGQKLELNKAYGLQKELSGKNTNPKDRMKVMLEIPDPTDFRRILAFCYGDC